MTVRRGPLRERAALEAWLGALLLAAVALATALADPAQPGPFPACPFRAVTGLDCPGCGSLRALHQLTRGHMVAAADCNALLLAFLPVAAGGMAARRHQQVPATRSSGVVGAGRARGATPLDGDP
ncbi:DUF2752 domain-containing protein [Streptomyces europaeiscabiei]|uniref:DUF2752 domain-containing protein n=1 Tax=Streptomyces europaeiscabiei TaxID=146819 RepID=UPI0039A6EECC